MADHVTGKTQLSHPFINGENTVPIPEGKEAEVDAFYQWMMEQKNVAAGFTKGHALLFLHACYWNEANSKKAFQKYLTIRANSPEIFMDRDPLSPNVGAMYDLAHMAALPHTTPEGYKLLIYRLANYDPSKMVFADAVKAFCMFNDVRLSEDGLADGYVVIFDMKGFRLSHLMRVSFGPLRHFMQYIQEAHPARLKKIMVVNTSSLINQIMTLVKPLIRSELMGLLTFISEGPESVLPLKLLPSDYGGSLPEVAVMHREQRAEIETKYCEWLRESAVLKELPKSKESSKTNIQQMESLKLEFD
ncbi:retinaldehyde-binding protein 1-like [Ctenocephalides felis]|uniref:retinaldehyde-binding protein 1-like n=1 Tax=Ctenocephalides felis TaxID=7515 RepID=UPI000E6E2F43|nr:retinaldehyde-binding protein 1-like [Ctenocephalides felis]XP_026466493.1 retinaldehyde-binding protein 1-like [Ctenocephalides felis]